MMKQSKFCLCRQFYFLPPSALVVSGVNHVVATTNIPVKSGLTTGGEYSDEGSVRARERWGRVCSMGTSFFRLRICTKCTQLKENKHCEILPQSYMFLNSIR
jgi:hypothetical protein